MMKVQVRTDHPGALKYGDLTPGNIYRVIGIEGDHFRLMSDEGLPYLYPGEILTVVDPTVPSDWETSRDEGETCSYPKELNKPGFFEDYFEGDRTAIATLRQYLCDHWRAGKHEGHLPDRPPN